MPRFYLVKGKPGLPVVNPHDVRAFLGREHGQLKGEPVEQVAQEHMGHIADAIAKGELIDCAGGPVVADNHEQARALLVKAAPKQPAKASRAGGDQ